MRSNAALALLALCATAAVAVGDCSLADRRTEVVLENRFVRARVDMMKGHITSLVHKPSKKELVNPLGLYKDNHLESGHWTGPFRNTPYFYKIVKNTPAEASLHMWSQGKDHLIMRKRLTLRRGESVLRVKHRMACAPTLYVDSFYSYRSHNGVGVPGERVTFFVPSSKGAKPIGLAIQGRADTLTFDPPQAWTGFVGESGVGAVFELDFRYLRYYSNWTEQKRSTCEWFFNTLKVPAGGGADFESDLLIFSGMNRLDGVRNLVAGGSASASRAPAGCRWTCASSRRRASGPRNSRSPPGACRTASRANCSGRQSSFRLAGRPPLPCCCRCPGTARTWSPPTCRRRGRRYSRSSAPT